MKNTLLGAVGAIAMIHATPAMAQSGPATPAAPAHSDAASSGDIVVTARRFEEKLQDVPISISTFSQQQLTDRNIASPADLSIYTPSLETNNFFGTSKTEFSIRGFIQDIGTQPSVGVYFGDVVAPRGVSVNVPVGDGAVPGNMFDLQNVQVLKGPQGTLFGRNTTGGAILLVPQKPTSREEGYIEGSYGNYNMERLQAVFNTPIGDNVRFRVGIDSMKRDGYLKNTGGVGPSSFDDVDYVAMRASLIVDITPTLENYTIASYTNSKTHGSVQKLAGCLPNVVFGALGCSELALASARGDGFYTVQNTLADPYDNSTQWQIINTTTWRANEWLTIKNIASYAELTESYSSEVFGLQLDASVFAPVYPAGTNVALATSQPPNGYKNADQDTITDEFRLQGEAWANRLIWQAGAYGELSEPLATTGADGQSFTNCANAGALICNNPLGFGGLTQYLSRTNLDDYGLYGQDTFKLTDKVSLTTGVRYTWDRAYTATQLYAFSYAAGPQQGLPTATSCEEQTLSLPNCAVHYRQASSKPTWLIDLDYKPMQDMLVYAKYARGYRAGGIAPNVPAQFATYNPEQLDSYEIGMKTSFKGWVRGTFDVAAFYNDLSNQQLLVLLSPNEAGLPPISSILNAGKSTISGVEVSTSITPFKGFTIDGAYTYLDTDLQKTTTPTVAAGAPYTPVASEQAGDVLPLSPANKLALTGTYTLPLDASIGNISMGATFIHVDSMLTNYSEPKTNGTYGLFDTVPSRNLLNLNLNWKEVGGSNFDIALFATNVLDKHYYTFFGPLLGSTGLATGAVGEPMMFGMRVRAHFGG